MKRAFFSCLWVLVSCLAHGQVTMKHVQNCNSCLCSRPQMKQATPQIAQNLTPILRGQVSKDYARAEYVRQQNWFERDRLTYMQGDISATLFKAAFFGLREVFK